MKLASLLTTSQKAKVKKLVLPILRIASGLKKISTKYKISEFGHKGTHTYFGYYDITPFQGDNIIYIEREKSENICKVVLNDIYNKSKQYIADSRAWNWRQGIRLRWFPKSENVISFNDYIDGKYIHRILDIKTNEERRLDWPLYDIDPFGKYGISLNFERLGVMRPGYGYTCEPYKVGDLWNDGISIIDIERNQLVKTITYKELSDSIKKIDDILHFYLNHLSFSPDGTKFLFFWIDEAKGFHQASLGVYDMSTNELIPLETEGKASHYVWDGANDIICTILDKKYNAGYYRFNVIDRTKKHICPNSLIGDGHPSVYAKDKLLTDTYPDKRGFQHIYLVDEAKDTKSELVKIYSVPTLNIEERTDLHPRISSDKQYVSFDSNYCGLRKMLILKLDR